MRFRFLPTRPRVSTRPFRPLTLLTLGLALLGTGPRAKAQTIPPASPDGVSQAVARQAGLEGRVLWVDATANVGRLNTVAGVMALFDHCARANINTVVVDVKPLSGHVMYDSRYAPRLKEWKGAVYPPGFDLMRTALAEGHRRGIKVYASVNVFSDGHKLVKTGPAWEKPDQQCLVYDIERTVTTPRGDRRTLAVGTNRTPGEDQVSLYDSGFGSARTFLPGEAFALVLNDRVESVVDGALAPSGGVNIPSDGYLLVGKGEGARWLLQSVKVGDNLAWSGVDRLIPIVDAPSETIAAFLNPANPATRDYELKIIDEVASRYEVDGVVFDRMRYPSLQADFSDLSRQKFEEYLGQKLNRFPADIYSFDPTPGRSLIWGPYFKQWLEWRAKNIRTWLEEAGKVVHEKRPEAKLAVYVGSWYGTYYSVGVNWGSEEYMPNLDWMTPTYNTTGYAGLLDWITTGCYHPVASRDQAKAAGLDDNYTVQAAAERSGRAIGDAAFFYAGIYVQDYKGSPEAFREAIRAARDNSAGVMLFDLSQIEDYGWWGVIEEELRDSRKAPHDVPELLTAVRALRKSLSAASRPALP